MKQKLQRYKQSLKQQQLKQPQYYQKQVNKCLKRISKVNHLKYLKSIKIGGQQLQKQFFIDLNQKLSQNIKILRQQIQENKKTKLQKSFIQLEKQNNQSLLRTRLNQSRNKLNKSQSNSFFKSISNQNKSKDKDKNKQNSHIIENNRISENIQSDREKEQSLEINPKRCKSPQIRRELFKTISLQSQKMVDFANCGLKYRHYVKNQNKNPWKKWYIQSSLQIFPGQIVKIKKLQKSIY